SSRIESWGVKNARSRKRRRSLSNQSPSRAPLHRKLNVSSKEDAMALGVDPIRHPDAIAHF
ncbi:MAG TPA: hypothetical protein VG269_10200, partial [Tepidisphaeraceae bacterium]|nr:hypothetical protein [Tepidisphaeraceae bacterium]